jgi:nucleoid DNA-binding protein
MLKTKIVAAIILSIISAVGISASSRDQQAVNIAVQGLSKKLQADLSMNKVNLKLGKVENQNVSSEEVRVSGFGTVQNAKDVSLTFDVTVNPVKSEIVNVTYDIVSPVAAEPESATENFLMKKVMGKIRNDYNTENIVMAIDTFEAVKSIDGKTNFVGVAEIRVDMEWNRIEFDVQGNPKTGAATEIKYKKVEE